MDTFETLFALALFAVRQGVQTALWVGLGAMMGLLGGGVAVLLLTWGLRRWRWSREHRGAALFVITACSLLALPLLLLAGTLVGAGKATSNLLSEDALLQETGEIALDGAAVALERARAAGGDPGELEEEADLALRLVRGEETFPIASLAELLQSFSQGTLESALEVYDDQVGLTLEARADGQGTLAQSVGRRFLVYLHDRSQQFGASWLAPVVADLELRDLDGDGEATGREMALSIARIHVQRPIARFIFFTFIITGATIAALGLAPLLLVPIAVWLLLRLFGKSTQPDTAPGREPSGSIRS